MVVLKDFKKFHLPKICRKSFAIICYTETIFNATLCQKIVKYDITLKFNGCRTMLLSSGDSIHSNVYAIIFEWDRHLFYLKSGAIQTSKTVIKIVPVVTSRFISRTSLDQIISQNLLTRKHLYLDKITDRVAITEISPLLVFHTVCWVAA